MKYTSTGLSVFRGMFDDGSRGYVELSREELTFFKAFGHIERA